MSNASRSSFDFLAGTPPEQLGPVSEPSLPMVGVDADRLAPPADLASRLAAVQAAVNPLLEAAEPLLRALADVPSTLADGQPVAALRALLNREVGSFQRICDRANLPWKHMAAARYCLCTALDEAANRTVWGGGGVWASNSLLLTHEGEVDGGEKFFLLIGRMAGEQQEYVDVLDVLYRILSLGFEGRYSVVEDGHRHLERIRQRLLSLTSGARDAVAQELSPHWRGTTAGEFRFMRSIPAWTTASVLGLLLLALFGWYKYQLLNESHHLEQRIAVMGKRAAPRVDVPKLSVLLKDEIAQGFVTVEEDARKSAVTFKGDNMFVPGKSQISTAVVPSLVKVARELAGFGGHVIVTGHTDSQPIHTAQYPDNLTLSAKRAALVVAALIEAGVQPGRIETVGKGDTQPLASNATAAGRARNRRVDIVVTP
jgi:type VI secretion system protein ImpK